MPRTFFLRKRRTLEPLTRQTYAKRTIPQLHKLFTLLRSRLPKNTYVGLYADAFGELPTLPIVFLCQQYDYTALLPVVCGKRLRFAPLLSPKRTSHQGMISADYPFKRHKLGMLEPLIKPAYSIAALDICFCPLVAVGKNGTRLGMGGGFYDRTLAQFTGVKVGYCYDFQVTEQLVGKPWDCQMDYIVTPTRLYIV